MFNIMTKCTSICMICLVMFMFGVSYKNSYLIHHMTYQVQKIQLEGQRHLFSYLAPVDRAFLK